MAMTKTPLKLDEMDAAHRERAVFVRAHVSPLLASCQPGWKATYEYDGETERVDLELGSRRVSVFPAWGSKRDLLVGITKALFLKELHVIT